MDINCDLGEGAGNDAAIMSFITSANIACGAHAGDETIMLQTLKLAQKHGVSAGAHPSWPDKVNFGRTEMQLPLEQVYWIVFEQIKLLADLAKSVGMVLNHVKPHGALYNQAAIDEALAETVARAVKTYNQELILVGLAGSCLPTAGLAMGLKVAHEAFPDRAYLPNGQLMPRSQTGAVLHKPQLVAENALRLGQQGISFGGRLILPDTLCLHGDNPQAVENARLVKQALLLT